MDDTDFLNLRKIVDSAKIMGYPTILCGFNPGVVASLVLLDVDLDGITAAKDIDDAFRILTPLEPVIENEDLEEIDREIDSEDENLKEENG